MSDKRSQPVALVTGGGKGIGAACCRQLAAAGCRVGIHYRNSSGEAENLHRELPDSFLVKGDLTDPDQVEGIVKTIADQAGQLDVLVNNAGVSINQTIPSMSLDDFDRQRSVLRGTWFLTKRVLRKFMMRKGGSIVNISSVVGHTGSPGQIPYTMEKAALDAMTKSLAKEMAGRNIRVNSVAPGFIETDMTADLPEEVTARVLSEVPLQRMGRPIEVAEAVCFLALNASYVNGTVLHVNGGMYGG